MYNYNNYFLFIYILSDKSDFGDDGGDWKCDGHKCSGGNDLLFDILSDLFVDSLIVGKRVLIGGNVKNDTFINF